MYTASCWSQDGRSADMVVPSRSVVVVGVRYQIGARRWNAIQLSVGQDGVQCCPVWLVPVWQKYHTPCVPAANVLTNIILICQIDRMFGTRTSGVSDEVSDQWPGFMCVYMNNVERRLHV